MPLQRRVPKFGFKNPFRVENAPVNLNRLAELVDQGRLTAGQTVSPETMRELGVIGKGVRVKILAGGDLQHALDIQAHAFSKSAQQKIEAAGGSVSILA